MWLMASMAGTVRPMVDSTEPRKMLIERCSWFAAAAFTAPMPSGVATSSAMTTPPRAAGACMSR